MDDDYAAYHTNAWKHSRLRVSVYNRLYAWNHDDPNEHPAHLAMLLGRGSDYFSPLLCMSEAEVNVCAKLLGVHGYSFYRMLLAQRKGWVTSMGYDQDMRQAVYDLMCNEWGLERHLLDDLPQHLADLCGRAEKFVFGNTLSDTERDICKKLLGEHGYAYYKALLARLEA